MMTRIRNSKWLLVLCGVLIVPVLRIGVAWAQQEILITGQDSSGNTRVVRTDSSGNILTSTPGSTAGAHGACTNTTMNVGTSATLCPPAARADRSSILIQLTQSGETLRVVTDGTNTASATQGAAIADGSAYNDNLAGTVNTSCRCTAVTCAVNITECP